jgi:hypothetical protein
VLEGLPPLVALEEVLTLSALLAPVGQYRERMAQVGGVPVGGAFWCVSSVAERELEHIEGDERKLTPTLLLTNQALELLATEGPAARPGPQQPAAMDRGGGGGGGGGPAGSRALGPALQAVIEYIVSSALLNSSTRAMLKATYCMHAPSIASRPSPFPHSTKLHTRRAAPTAAAPPPAPAATATLSSASCS